MIELLLPFPPSVNKYWRHVLVGRSVRAIVSRMGRSFHKNAGRSIREQAGRPQPLKGRLAVSIDLHMPDRRTRDIDNYQKAIFDTLTQAGIWQDDGQVDELHVYRREAVKGGLARIEIRRLDGVDKTEKQICGD